MFSFLFKRNKKTLHVTVKRISRRELKKKVEEGTAQAIQYYGRSLKKLAEFDRT